MKKIFILIFIIYCIPFFIAAQEVNHVMYFLKLSQAELLIADEDFAGALALYQEADIMVNNRYSFFHFVNAAKCAAITGNELIMHYYIKKTVQYYYSLSLYEKDTLFNKYNETADWKQTQQYMYIHKKPLINHVYRNALDSLDIEDRKCRIKYKRRKTFLFGIGARKILQDIQKKDSLIHKTMDSLCVLYGYPTIRNVGVHSNYFTCYHHRASDSIYFSKGLFTALKRGDINPNNYIYYYNLYLCSITGNDKYLTSCDTTGLSSRQILIINKERKKIGYPSICNELKIITYFYSDNNKYSFIRQRLF